MDGWMGCTRWDAVGPPSPGPPPVPSPRGARGPMHASAPCMHPEPVQLRGAADTQPQLPPHAVEPISPGQRAELAAPALAWERPWACKVHTQEAEPPAPCPRPPCMGASHPCLVLTERAKRLQIPAPSTYFLHAGECVLQQVRVGQDLVGRRRRICVSAPCFMALESGRWRQAAAGSAWSPGPARPCRVSRTPRSEAVRDRDPPLCPDPRTPMTLGLTPCCPQSQQHPPAQAEGSWTMLHARLLPQGGHRILQPCPTPSPPHTIPALCRPCPRSSPQPRSPLRSPQSCSSIASLQGGWQGSGMPQAGAGGHCHQRLSR